MEKIPATVVTGFLGAGKTTLIRNLIANANGRRIALIVNEFGDIGVDGDVLKACGNDACTEDDIIELANGCICCTVAEDFIPTMEKILAREERPDCIVIETSGLALPQPLVRAFNWPEIKTQVTVDGVVTLVDAAAVADGRFAADEGKLEAQRAADDNLDHDTPLAELFEDQIACADLIVVSKADLVDETALSEVEATVREDARPATRLIRSKSDGLPSDLLLGLSAAAESDNRMSHHEQAHFDAGEGIVEHEHDHDDFESFAISCGEVGDANSFVERVAAAMRAHDILRLKGFVAVEGKPMRLVVQAVGPRVDSYFDRAWSEGEARQSRLVVIGEVGLDIAGIATALGVDGPADAAGGLAQAS
ncbi:MAG: cobalamin biosynthesis protein CobW [Pseudomonadota bacterium]